MSLAAEKLPEFAPEPVSSARRALHLVLETPLLLLVFGALAVVLFGSTWSAPFSRVVGIGPDPPVFIWYLRWVPFALTHGMNPLFTNYLDYPSGINLMWQTSIPLLGLLLWPVTITAGPIFAYNLVMTASIATAGWCAFLAFRRHVRRPVTAVAGALLFAFSPYMLAESLGHPHVAVTFICPLMLIAFEEAVIHQRQSPLRLGLVLGALASAQLLISEELLLTQALMAAIALAILGSWKPEAVRSHVGYLARVLLPAAAMVLAVGAWPLTVQFFGPQAIHGKLLAGNVFVSDLAGLILPTSQQAIAPPNLASMAAGFSGSQYEAGAYLGLPLLALLALTLPRWWTVPVVRVASEVFLLAIALSLGVTIHVAGWASGVPVGLLAVAFIPLMRTKGGRVLPLVFTVAWLAISTLPVLDNIVPSRLAVYIVLFAGLLCAVVADRSLDLRRSLWGTLNGRTTMVLGLLALLALLPRVPFASSEAEVPAIFQGGHLASIAPGSIVLVVPYAHDLESRAMLWQAVSGMHFRMPEGYANRGVRTLDPPQTTLGEALIAMETGGSLGAVSPETEKRAAADLQAWRVSAIIVGPMSGQQQVVAFLSAVVGKAPTWRDGVIFWQLDES